MSKFINKETLEYLKKRHNSTLQQQVSNLRERVNIESTDLTNLVNDVGHLKDAQNQDRVDYFQALEDAMKRLDHRINLNSAGISNLVYLIKRYVKIALLTGIALAIGVLLCLAKLLI